MLPFPSAAGRGAIAALVVGLVASCPRAAHADDPVPVSPERLWRAVVEQPELQRDGTLDLRRYEGRAVGAGGVSWTLDVDWDEVSGGAWLRTTPASPEAKAWVARVAERAKDLPHLNRYCRGGNPDLSVPEPSVDAARSCDHGNFSSAIHELEKCADHETTLRLLSACMRSGHAAGLVRIAQRYDNGLGLPQRPERATHFLALAARSSTPGYSLGASVMYATALYFGEGVPADRPQALTLFRRAAQAGDVDARTFLAEGWHTAMRRPDGTLYRDVHYRPSREDAGVVVR